MAIKHHGFAPVEAIAVAVGLGAERGVQGRVVRTFVQRERENFLAAGDGRQR
jgi:hypothetical protein